ncbi:Hsp70 family protein [Dactylosporangium roseum]|uniref:Hsp70 family protein n=1 Tax=Dactylosporangium roseum TaxID=47989 RepID=A0ABY5ZD21_9ACTN|nr:Hsp70 family protein [Dactylosporangium roseum]UWZ40026.1 Hsp70 family protein [Dactylosporangium roseum]
MDVREYRLGVDFGTSNTVAMLAWPDGNVRPLLFDGSPTLPSAVYADPHAGLLVGRDAAHAARVSPERFEPNPKRRVDEPTVLLGDHEIPTVDVIAAVLARVVGEARRVSGGPLGRVTLTCPAAWAQTRRGVLLAAAERAGLGAVALLPEPVAAAQVFRAISAASAGPGSTFVVYDLGAGTFDASVVRHGAGTFEVLATEGLSTSGGLDIDAAVVAHLGAIHAARDPAAWSRLLHPIGSADRRANRLLWDDVRAAKEMLSRTSTTMIHIPAFDVDVPLGRDQFEQLARPILAATVTATRAAIASAGLSPAGIAGVFLVGGGSRIPLVATLLHQALGVAPTAVEQPELVVAQGAVGAAPAPATPVPGPAGPPPGAGGPFPPGAAGPAAPFAVSGPPAVPASAVPASPGPVSAAPVSPGFGATHVAAYPAPSSGPPAPPAGIELPPSRPEPTPAPAGRAAVPPSGYGAASPVAPAPPPSGPKRRTGVVVAAAVAVLLVIGLGVYGVTKLGGAGDDNSGDRSVGQQQTTGGEETPGEQVAADVEQDNVDWYTTATAYTAKPGRTIAYQCPANGTIGTVWGSGPYTLDSSVCTAAVHAGYINLADGGRVVIKIVDGQDSYTASTQFGIVTSAWDDYSWSFQIVG